MSDLRVQVLDDDIVVTRPGTAYRVVYHKPAGSSQLLTKEFPERTNLRAPVKTAKFLAKACEVANVKARKLGWIP
jgi:hypothetical protein